MSWSLDEPVFAGGAAFVAIADTHVAVAARCGWWAGQGAKRAVLILIVEAERVRAIDMTGRVQDPEEVERLYPDAIEHARRRVDERRPASA